MLYFKIKQLNSFLKILREVGVSMAKVKYEIALFLKDKGADLTKKDNAGKTTSTYIEESECKSLKKPSWFRGGKKTKSTRRRRSKTKATRKR